VVLALATLLGVSPGARAQAPLPRLAHPSHVQVTGQVMSPLDYLRRGLSPRQASVLAPLDRLAAQGADRRVLQAAVDASGEGSASFGSASPSAQVVLTATGDLDGRDGADVLEIRYVSDRSGTTALFVARAGRTGARLWSVQRELGKGDIVFPIPADVGPGGRAGVVLYKTSFGEDDQTTTLEALDGAARHRWTRSFSVAPLPPGDGGPDGFSFTMASVYLWYDVAVARGSRDVLVLAERSVYTDDGVRFDVHGDSQFSAVSEATGALRALTSRVASADGYTSGDTTDDQTGDGLTDLSITVGGSAPSVTVFRGYDGAKAWTRTDVTVPLWGDVGVARAWSDRTHGTPALYLLTSRDPGRLRLSPDALWLLPVAVPVQDPTAGTHGVVALLAPRTGATLWSRAGDLVYRSGTGLVPALGVVLDNSSTSATTVTAALQLDVVRSSGALAWTRTYSLSGSPSTSDGTGYAWAWAAPMQDLDGDGAQEGLVILYVEGEEDDERHSLVRSRDGQPLADQTSELLWGGVTRSGNDRYRVTAGQAGETLTVLRGRDGKVAFTRLVPGSKDVTSLYAEADRLGTAVCADVLASGSGRTRAVLAVLASDGSPRWWLSNLGTDTRPGTPSHPVRAPRPRC
jgi:hypothetical protein